MQATLERLQQRRRELGEDEGFTLIELLIVIVILGILAAIVVFAVQNLTSQSASSACQSQYKTVETAMESYKAQTGAYPATGDTALTTTLEGSGTAIDGSGSVGPWLKDVPPVSSTTSSPYYINWDGTNVGVGTIKANGAKATDAAAAGAGNCKDA